MTITVRNNDNLIDLALRAYNGTQGVMQLWADNDTIDFTSDLTKGDEFVVNSTLRYNPPTDTPKATIEGKVVKPTVYVALKGQSLEDIAIQEYGSMEGMAELLRENPSLSPITILEGGEEIMLTGKVLNRINLTYLKERKVIISTEEGLSGTLLADGQDVLVSDGQGNVFEI